VIDGATDTLAATVATGTGPDSLAVNPVTNKVYVANGSSNNVTVIDGAINSTTTTVTDPNANYPFAVAVMLGENKTYVVNNASNNVTSIKEQQVATVPLTATITALTGNTTTNPTPTFTFTASSTFSPNATTPNNLLFQVDGWQGPWTAATNNGGGNFSATLPALSYGIHALFAYATDGQDTTVAAAGSYASSPLIGNIVGYGFLVTPATPAPVFSAAPSPLAFGRVADFTTSGPTPLTVTDAGNADLTISGFTLTGTNAADFAIYTDGCSGTTVPANGACAVEVTFTPTVVGSETATLTFSDNAADTPQTVSLTGTGLAAPVTSFSPGSVTFPGQVINTPSASTPVILTNAGTGAMTIRVGGISTTGDFSQTSNCPISPNTLGVGSKCTINVTFTPTVVGPDAGSLQIADDAADSPQMVTLTGTGLSAGVPSPSSPSLDFGTHPVGTTTSTTVTITNNGTGPLGSLSVSVIDPLAIPCDPNVIPGCNPLTDGSLPYQFTQTNNCPSTLAVSAHCTITVNYRALTLGGVSGTLAIANDGATNPLNIALTGTASAVPFANGEVFLGVSNGKIQRRSATGQLIQVMGAGVSQDIAGMAFDSAGNLYATAFQDLKIQKFDGNGNLLGTFVDFSALGLTGEPESILFDGAGNAYVGAPDNTFIYKFDSNGNLLNKFIVARELRGTDWIEIASDQCTIYYTSEGTSILRYNVCTQAQLPDFTSALGGPSYALRIRPNGEVLVADSSKVVRLDASANSLQTYTPTNTGNLFGLNLDPDGTSFWTADLFGTEVYKIDINTGNQLVQYTVGSPDVGGITVKGEINVATSPAVTLSATTLTMPDTPLNLTCTPRAVTLKNTGNGALTISGIATSDSTVFAISANTCPISPSTLGAGASCDVSVVFHPTVTGTVTGTLTITSNAPGSPHVVGLSGTGKAACPLAAAVQTQRVLRGTDQTAFTVYPNPTCQATDQIQLACVNAAPATCAFNPGTIQNPEKSVLAMANLRAVGGNAKQFEVTGTSADFIQRTLYLQVLFSDFSFTTYPTQATVKAGGTASYALSIVPVNGLEGRVSLTCTGAPAGGSCTVVPSAVNVANDAPVEVQVKVQTSSGGMILPLKRPDLRLPVPDVRLRLLLWSLVALLLAGLAMKKSRSAARLAIGGAMLLAMMMWGSCGGGGTAPPVGVERSTAGTYTLVVRGTFTPTVTTDPSAPALDHQATLTLNVQ
jgi:YVTN family beta-propeller protein